MGERPGSDVDDAVELAGRDCRDSGQRRVSRVARGRTTALLPVEGRALLWVRLGGWSSQADVERPDIAAWSICRKH